MAVTKRRKQPLEQIIKAYEKKQANIITSIMVQIMSLFDSKVTEIAFIYAKRKLIGNRFLPKDIRETIQRITNTVNAKTKDIIINGIGRSFVNAETKNDIIETQVASNGRRIPPGKRVKFISGQGGRKGLITAVDEFVKRKNAGLNLSQRVFKLSSTFKKSVNDTMIEGLKKGTSARELAKDLRKNLRNNQFTENPGQGVYKSPQKNAMRLSRSEINLAYANADFERWQLVDSIIGIEVRLSNSHPKYDICFTNPLVKVMTSKGHKPICKIEVGDLVLTHTGKYRKVLTKFKSSCKEVNTTKIYGKFMYDNRGKEQFLTATDNHPLLVNGKWKPISEIKPGDECTMLANECKKCNKLIPYTREYCSKSCASWPRCGGTTTASRGTDSPSPRTRRDPDRRRGQSLPSPRPTATTSRRRRAVPFPRTDRPRGCGRASSRRSHRLRGHGARPEACLVARESCGLARRGAPPAP